MAKLKKSVFKHVESELFAYHETIKEIHKLRTDILHGDHHNEREEISIVKGANSVREPGDPTGIAVASLVTNKRLLRLEEIVNAIDKVYKKLPEEKQRLVQVTYWTKPQTLTWQGIADALCVNRATAIRWRNTIVLEIAKELGWG